MPRTTATEANELEQALLIRPKIAHRGLADCALSCELGTDSLKLFDPVQIGRAHV